MNLTDDRLKELDDSALTQNERILLRCRLATQFIHEGQFEAAREALGELWPGVGERPVTKGLPPAIAADVLLQCGMLSDCLGAARNISGAQEKAIELLFEALRMFKSLRQPSKVSVVRYGLSMCYWRLGAFDRAREILDDALKGLGEQDAELKAKILIRQTVVEVWTGRYYEAWGILDRAREFFETGGDALKGKWHGQKAIVLLKLALTLKRPDYADRAIIEFTAAIFHYERAGHERYCGTNHNNLAVLLYQMGRYAEAHENLDRAQEIFERHQDPGNLAQVNETRARVLVAEHRYEEANSVIAGVINTFEKSGERALLADALAIQGIVWARLGVHESSIHILHRATTVAQDSGAFPNAGQAALTLIEEHGASRLSETELYTVYRRADNLLKDTQDVEDITRLRACARIVTRRLAGARLGTKEFSLPKAVLAFEAKFIREALKIEKGSISRAAKRLGIRHQSLTHLLEARHPDLLSLRTPAKPRPRSILSHAPERGRHPAKVQARRFIILHVEDHNAVADAVKDTLEAEGCRVATCGDGAEAVRTLESDAAYDLLIVDGDLPNVNGLEIVRRARRLPHRREVPVVMLSAGEAEEAAREAGVDVFLRKPEGIRELAAAVGRLLPDGARSARADEA